MKEKEEEEEYCRYVTSFLPPLYKRGQYCYLGRLVRNGLINQKEIRIRLFTKDVY